MVPLGVLLMQQPDSMMRRLFCWPSQNISLAIFISLIIGFVAGLGLDTTPLKRFVLPLTFVIIYPSMIGFRFNEIFGRSHGKLLAAAMLVNFTLVPGVAYLLGTVFLADSPQLFAGLAIAALLPTSNMTISFTMMSGGNVPASVKMTAIGLLLGSVLAPWYLYIMVGRFVPVDVLATMKTVGIVILTPLVLGMLTYRYLLQKYSPEFFQKQVKPVLPAVSAWGVVAVIILSISMNSQAMVSRPEILARALAVHLVFYTANYTIAVLVGRRFFSEKDALSLVYSIVLHNLSISIGLAAAAFGPDAAFMVSLAILIQGQAAAWFVKLNRRYGILGKGKVLAEGKA